MGGVQIQNRWRSHYLFAITLFLFFPLLASLAAPIYQWETLGGNPSHNGYYPIIGRNDINNFTLQAVKLPGGGNVYPQPSAYDIDGDGTMEIIISSDPYYLNCVSSSGTIIWSKQFPNIISTSATIYDLNKDGRVEIIIGCWDGRIYTLNHKGVILWTFFIGSYYNLGSGHIQSSPAVDDIDRDGEPEIVFGSDVDILYCLDSSGRLEWSINLQETSLPLGITSTPTLYDVNNDGLKEIIVGSDYRYLYTIHLVARDEGGVNELKPEILWRFATQSETLAITCAPLVIDLDVDSDPEIIFGTKDGCVYCLSSMGDIEWSYQTDGPIHNTCSIADVDNDDSLNVVIGSYDKSIYIFNNKGDLLTRIQAVEKVFSQIILCDLDGDGDLNLITSTQMQNSDNAIYILDSDGTNVHALYFQDQLPGNDQKVINPIVCDLNNDGFIEIIVGTNEGYLLLFSDANSIRPVSEEPRSWIDTYAPFLYTIIIILCCFVIIMPVRIHIKNTSIYKDNQGNTSSIKNTNGRISSHRKGRYKRIR